MDHFDLDLRLPALTGLSLRYYAAGFLIRRSKAEWKAWGEVLLNSGLVLGILVSMTTLVILRETSGWYVLLIAVLFAVELFARPFRWLELAVEALLSLALFQILDDLNSTDISHFLFGASLIWLGGDLLFGLLVQEKRPGRPITLAIGCVLVLVSTLALWTLPKQTVAVIYYSLYAL